MSKKFRQFKEFYTKYERWLIPGALVFGVIVDFVTFKSIEINTAFLILGGHVVIAGASILLLNSESLDPSAELRAGKLGMTKMIAPLALQFSFGALLSASLIFYWFSGAFSVSWPVLGIIAILMMSNEVFRHYYQKPIIQFAVFYFILFSLGTLVLPFLFNSIDVSVFIFAGFGSLIVMLLFLLLLSHFVQVRQQRIPIVLSILCVFTIMNAFYFFNMIPPIPLSLREAGVYHDVRRVSGEYRLTSEKESWFGRFLPGQIVHLQKGKSLSVFTSIFAPAKLNTTIYHRWQFFDETQGKWIDKDRLSFGITGGRDEGYRGYSMKSALFPGRWRVRVETHRGQVLGRIDFRIEQVEEPVYTESI